MKEIIYKMLWSTIEDFVGLWEIHWELNYIFSENSETENKQTVKKVIQYFLENGLVKFYFSKWGSDTLTEIDFPQSFKMLNEEEYWEAPEMNGMCLKIGSTEKGEKFYNEELIMTTFGD